MSPRTAYGLVIDSEIALPELDAPRGAGDRGENPDRPGRETPDSPDPDVRVRLGTVPDSPDDPVEDGRLYRVEGGHYVSFETIGTVLVSDGESIVVEPAGDVEPAVIRQLVLGRGLRLLLHQRGYVVLHASTAIVDGQAVSFVGESGQGKSTTVAGFYGEGHDVAADDVTPVDPETAEVLVGFQQVKLDRAAVEAVSTALRSADATGLARQYYAVPGEVERESVSLGRVYLLDDGPAVRIESVPPSGRPYHLMRSATAAYDSVDDEAVEETLEDCARLGAAVPVKRLERPREYDALPDVVRAVEDDLAGPPEEAE